MCGIVGLLAICDSMAARGPDGRRDRVSGHGLGGREHKRRTIIDLSDADRGLGGWAKLVFRRHVRL